MRRGIIALGLAFAALAPAGVAAQTSAWDTPSFQAPTRDDDIGAYFIKPRDTDWGIAATWRQGGGLNLGVRGEYVQVLSGVSRWGIAGEAKGGLGPVAPPLAFQWTAGVGALVGGGAAVLRVPVGLTIGLHLAGGGMAFTPYVHPRVSFNYFSFDQDLGGGSETKFQVDTDVGADLDLTPTIVVRGGFTFGDQPGFGVGLALRQGRH